MLDNYQGNRYREVGYKKKADNSEIPFNFEYVDINSEVESFLSNLQMVGDTVVIKTSKNLDWTVKDIILLGKENKDRYQLISVNKVKKSITKNFYVSRITYDYVLTLNA
jgi:hypothetical protein